MRRTRVRMVKCSRPQGWTEPGHREVRVVEGADGFRVEIGPRWWGKRTAQLLFVGCMAWVLSSLFAFKGISAFVTAWKAGTLAWTTSNVVFALLGFAFFAAFKGIGLVTLWATVWEFRFRSESIEMVGGQLEHRIRTWRGWRMARVRVADVRYTTIGPVDAVYNDGHMNAVTGVVVRAVSGRIHVGQWRQGEEAWEVLQSMRALGGELRIAPRFARTKMGTHERDAEA